jgi:hypothetical protein
LTNKFKIDQRPKYKKCKIIKVLEENTGENLCE